MKCSKQIFCFLLVLLSIYEPTLAQKKGSAKKKKPAKLSTTVVHPTKPASFNKINAVVKPHGVSNKIVNTGSLQRLDELIRQNISAGAFPGCQIVALKDGEIIVQKSYGTYNKNGGPAITDTTMFDIASVTKIVSTTLAVMKLYEEGKIGLKVPISVYLEELKGTDKENIRVDQLLLHQGGLKSWIPFHKKAIDTLSGMLNNQFFRSMKSDSFPIPVAANLFMRPAFKFRIWHEINTSSLDNKGKYVYSDLDLLYLEKIIEKISEKRLDTYVYDNFYAPLKLRFTFYNPWILGLQKQCAPTENDQYFRFQHIQGYVHDPVAALMGGVAGHAGIFSTATEVATIMQMLLNGGVYKGKQYLKKETVQLFTGYRSGISRRGYGFDKPEKKVGDGGPAADVCSKNTFGHTGFTGTCAWADPETGIVFVLLSNRVNPSQDNKLIQTLKTRGRAQYLVYEALGDGK